MVYNKRKRYQNKLVKRAVYATMKAQAGRRVYRHEDRTGSIQCAPGQYSWQVLGQEFGIVELQTVIDSATGHDSDATGGNSLDQHRKFVIEDYKSQYHFRCLSPHPVFVTYYVVTPRLHMMRLAGTGFPPTGEELMMDKIEQGWKSLMNAATDAFISRTANVMTTESRAIKLSDSKEFKKHYKVEKMKKLKLNAGDDVYVNLKCPKRFTYDPKFWSDTENSGDNAVYQQIKGCTKLLLVFVEGALGHDTVDQTLVGPMSCDLAYEFKRSARVYEYNKKDDTMAVSRTEEAFANLEGPSEHLMKEDD